MLMVMEVVVNNVMLVMVMVVIVVMKSLWNSFNVVADLSSPFMRGLIEPLIVNWCYPKLYPFFQRNSRGQTLIKNISKRWRNYLYGYFQKLTRNFI